MQNISNIRGFENASISTSTTLESSILLGDVNGDGAVDAFDAIAVDLADKTAYYMGDVYDDAADDDGNGIIDATDYAAVKAMVTCAK